MRAGIAVIAAPIGAAEERERAGAVVIADIGGAGVGIDTTSFHKIAVKGVRATPVRVTHIVGAGIAVAAVGIDLLTGGRDALLASGDSARTEGIVVDADVVLATLAAGAIRVDTATIGGNTGVATAALGGRVLAAGVRAIGNRATRRVAATRGPAALVVAGKAAFVLRFAEDEWIFTAELFAVAVPEAAGVVAAFTVSRRVRECDAVGAAVRTAFIRSRAGTDAGGAVPGLLAGAGDRLGLRCRSARRSGVVLQ